MRSPNQTRSPQRVSVTKWSVAALIAGIGFGLLGHFSGAAVFSTFGAIAKPIGDIWISALRILALPLALVLTLSAIVGSKAKAVGALGTRAVTLFIVLLIAAGLFTLTITPVLLSRYSVDPATIAAMTTGTAIPESVSNANPTSTGGWVGMLVPRNIFEAAARGDVFPLLVFVIFFGLAVTQLADEYRAPIAQAVQSLTQTMLVMVHWLVIATPVGVFALSYLLALHAGGSLAGMLGVYLLLQPIVVLLMMTLLYLLSVTIGRTTLTRFARAVAPAQLVAISTRSSVAALPALIEGGRHHLRLPEAATSFVMPLSVSLFRISHMISPFVKLTFLAHIYGITLRPGVVVAFFVSELAFSLSSTGIPNSGGGHGYRAVPIYLAAGIPIEGIIILEAVETIPDIFDTVINVTGQMSTTTILSRASRLRAESANPDVAEPLTEVV